MINIVGFHHVSLTVTDLEKSKHFYGTVLGLPELDRPPFDFPGAWYQAGDQQIHLIQYPEATTFRPTNNIDTKDGHIALRVKNYEETVQHLKKHNVPYKENHGTKSGFIQVFCMDPDRNLIEFNVEPS